jgi:hypothetical protein
MLTTIQTITPSAAKNLLEKNTGNFRKPDKQRVTHYANEMQLGRWVENGDTIKISCDDVLLDGQHRLLAVVQSGVPIKCIVVTGLDNTSAATMDRGRPRTIAQWLTHSEIKNANTIAAVSRIILIHEYNLWSVTSVGMGIIPESKIIDFAINNAAALQNSLVHSAIPYVPRSMLSAVMYIATNGGGYGASATADWFFQSLNSGENLSADDPVLHLRNRLIASGSRRQLSSHMIRMLTTLAWNKTANDETCSGPGLIIRLTGPTKTKLPGSVTIARDL